VLISPPMHWTHRPKAAVVKLRRENHELAIRLLRVREQLQTSERQRIGLEVVLHERLERIDELNAKLVQSRQQIKRLDEENERLAEMVRFAPQVDSLARRRRKDGPHPAAASPLI